MSGRGRGISNAPAWMTRGGGGGGGLPPAGDNLGRGGGPPPPSHQDGGGGGGGGGNYPPPMHQDSFGRLSRDPLSRRGGPPPPPYDHRRYDDRGGGGGGGGGRDHRHHQRGPPPPDQWEGRGRGGDAAPPRRGSGPRGGGGGKGDDDFMDDGGGSDRREQLHRNKSSSSSAITFRSFDEERDWVDDRRRKRKARPGRFDVPPTAAQLAVDAAVSALANPAATDFAGIPAGRDFAAVPQQTRHARRLYIGHLPPNLSEEDLHVFFRDAIRQALVTTAADGGHAADDDPILSVYINHERRFCFLEFRTVEMATACLALDGVDINGKGKVKVKRPNDYNPSMAPEVHPSAIPVLDVSKLGIVSGTVQDGPNKVFIGGLHYHLTESQVLELLRAFGEVKSFHLVKNEPDSLTSKGYCFVEYNDPNVTLVAVMGLNGMDLGGGKVLTARVAGDRSGMLPSTAAVPMFQGAAALLNPGAMYGGAAALPPPPPGTKPGTDAVIISGYDIETLVDAAMGLRQMPMAPTHLDQFGHPITRTSGVILPPALPIPVIQQPQVVPVSTGMMGVPMAPAALPPGASALDIANAALDAAFGQGASFAMPHVATVGAALPPMPAPAAPKTRVLVLHNMVSDEDLKADDDYEGLKEEVEEEVRKFGKLLGVKIPRTPSPLVDASAIRKIFLEYATVQDAANAERELAGRQFGPNTVQATFHDEKEFAAGRLY